MKRILFLISLTVLVNKVQAQKRTVPSNSFSQALKALQAERNYNENLKAQKAPSIDKLLLFRRYDFARIESILTDEDWQYISGEKTNNWSIVNYAYNTTIDNKAWYKLGIAYCNDANHKLGNMVKFEHDSKIINKGFLARLYVLDYKLKMVNTAQDGLVKMFYSYIDKTVIILMNENKSTGYGQYTSYSVAITISDPMKRDSIENVPNISYYK